MLPQYKSIYSIVFGCAYNFTVDIAKHVFPIRSETITLTFVRSSGVTA